MTRLSPRINSRGREAADKKVAALDYRSTLRVLVLIRESCELPIDGGNNQGLHHEDSVKGAANIGQIVLCPYFLDSEIDAQHSSHQGKSQGNRSMDSVRCYSGSLAPYDTSSELIRIEGWKSESEAEAWTQARQRSQPKVGLKKSNILWKT